MAELRSMADQHRYTLDLHWQGDHTRTYESYTREHIIRIAGKHELRATADPMFLGDATLHNPEDLLLSALSGCHLLTYLALCARARINVSVGGLRGYAQKEQQSVQNAVAAYRCNRHRILMRVKNEVEIRLPHRPNGALEPS